MDRATSLGVLIGLMLAAVTAGVFVAYRPAVLDALTEKTVTRPAPAPAVPLPEICLAVACNWHGTDGGVMEAVVNCGPDFKPKRIDQFMPADGGLFFQCACCQSGPGPGVH